MPPIRHPRTRRSTYHIYNLRTRAPIYFIPITRLHLTVQLTQINLSFHPSLTSPAAAAPPPAEASDAGGTSDLATQTVPEEEREEEGGEDESEAGGVMVDDAPGDGDGNGEDSGMVWEHNCPRVLHDWGDEVTDG